MIKIEQEAKKIINKFYYCETEKNWFKAKEKALICINEILNALYEFHYDSVESYDYYIEVKKQIELL